MPQHAWRATLILVAGLAAPSFGQATVDPGKLYEEVRILEQVWELRLTRAQAQAMLPEMTALRAATAELEAARRKLHLATSEAVVAVEYALLRGEQPAEEQLKLIRTATEAYNASRKAIDRRIDSAMQAVDKILKSAQRQRLESDEQYAARVAAERLRDVARVEAAEQAVEDLNTWVRTASEADYGTGKADRVAKFVVVAYPAADAMATADRAKALEALFDQVRALKPADHMRQRAGLRDRVLQALAPLPVPGPKPLMSRAEWRTWLADPATAAALTQALAGLPAGE